MLSSGPADPAADAGPVRERFWRDGAGGAADGAGLWRGASPGTFAEGPARAATAALPCEGEERHLSVHGRWAVPGRYIRPQAAAGERAWAADQDGNAADPIR